MSGSGYVSLSLASQLERSLDMSAHNLANANTAGFKAFHPLLKASSHGAAERQVDFVANGGTYLDLTEGALVPTGNPYDLALAGDGWFGVRIEGDQTAYTRHGKFLLDAEGLLKTSHGHSLLDAGGAPIALPQDIGLTVTIMKDGTISTPDGEVLGQVGVFQIDQDQRMSSLGHGVYSPTGEEDPQATTEADVVQGFIETSNVQSVLELTRLINIQRAYENAMQIVGEDHGLTKQAIERLGRNG
ncbi:MAG: flagellar hook basal-body protein [Rhodobacteraceae bacterium]|nr:flagellar hook basal-body protein [Paracoccaceae bacterium]